jgi:hypothetical protein
MGYLHNGVNTGGLPIDYIKPFVDEYGIKVFIETGTAGGDSVTKASEIFEICHSIELAKDPKDYVDLFKDNVTIHFGDSGEELKGIAKPYKGQRVLFWLDAHWSEDYESDDHSKECPLIREIQAIKGHDALVLIDDARLFLGPHPWPCDYRFWPQFQDVFNALRDSFPRHRITIIDDYIIAVPDYMDDIFRLEWWARFKVRYPEQQDLIKSQMRHVVDYFKKFIE